MRSPWASDADPHMIGEMPDDFECVEAARERDEGFAYEAYHDRFSESAEQADAYERDDPKHPDFHETFSDVSDLRDDR